MGTARNTFIIDESGLIEEIIDKVDTKNHTDQILRTGATTPKAPARKNTARKTAAKKTATKKTKGKP
jgi:peroxiredoxin Q/BCP